MRIDLIKTHQLYVNPLQKSFYREQNIIKLNNFELFYEYIQNSINLKKDSTLTIINNLNHKF